MIIRPDSMVFTPWWYTYPTADDFSVYGSGGVWGDESDATYVQFAGDPFSPVPTATFPATATSADLRTVFIRCQATEGSVYIGWELRDNESAELFTLHSNPDVLVPGTITDLEVPFDGDNGTMTSALNAGRLAVTVEAMGGTGTVLVYEVWLELVDPTTRRRAHLRQYPRSPLRHWPPERSVQRSNRQGPGAYR